MSDIAPRFHSGLVVTSSLESDAKVNVPTFRCCHGKGCGGAIVQVVPGSGKRRGFCGRCMAYTCGHPACDLCVAFEQVIENMEQGRPLDFRPVVVPFNDFPR